MATYGPLGKSGVEVVSDRADRPIPRPPDDLHPELVQQWRDYWSSDVANAADDVDLPLITRLFIYRDEWHRLSLAYGMLPMEDRLVAGSRHAEALRIHPWADRMTKLEDMIQKIEDKLGLSPLSRARLGIELGQAKLTWQQVQAATTRLSSLPVSTAKELEE